jgi:hypothetical protein
LFNNVLTVAWVIIVQWYGHWVRYGRKWSRPILRYYNNISLEGLRKQHNTAVMVAGILVFVRNPYGQNSMQES